VQQAQQNYRGLTAAILIALATATAAGTVSAAATDPRLAAGQGLCDPGPSYVPGTDIDGNSVVSADLVTPSIPLPDDILVPLGKTRSGQAKGWASLDRDQLHALLDPKPACPSAQP
jgi:hypothetical protein